MPGLMAASRQRSSSRRTLASFIRARSRRLRSARGRVAPSRRAGSSSLARPIASHFRALRFIRRRTGARRLARFQLRALRMPSSPERPSVAVDPRPFVGEHSLEMHLVMLQAMLPAPFEIVPVLVGDADPHIVAEALRQVWGGPETVVAVSSDLSHFLDQTSASSIDSDTARRIETLDAAALDGRRACGFLAVKGALEIAAERDMRISGLHLATSADAGADASRVVGYGAFAFEYAASARLAESDRERLLSACMIALRHATKTGGKPSPMSFEGEPPSFSPWRATFVTLTENEQLRGCIGSLEPRRPLIEDALANTAQAAFADPRFPPLRELELTGVRIDISILSHPRPTSCGKRVRTRGCARARSRWAYSLSRQAARAVPAERLAASSRRARVCAASDHEGGLWAQSLARRARGETLSSRIVRRAMAAGRCEGRRTGGQRR